MHWFFGLCGIGFQALQLFKLIVIKDCFCSLMAKTKGGGGKCLLFLSGIMIQDEMYAVNSIFEHYISTLLTRDIFLIVLPTVHGCQKTF